MTDVLAKETKYTEQQILNLWQRHHGSLVSGVKTLSSAATAAAIVAQSVPCRWVDVVAIGGRIAIGDDDVVETSGSERGIILYPGNLPYRILIEDLQLLFAAGANGTRLCYDYLPL